MEQVFSYIIGLGAAVMMPILFTILGVCIGINFGKALKSGLLVGVGFVGLSVVTALLISSLGEKLKKVTKINQNSSDYQKHSKLCVAAYCRVSTDKSAL